MTVQSNYWQHGPFLLYLHWSKFVFGKPVSWKRWPEMQKTRPQLLSRARSEDGSILTWSVLLIFFLALALRWLYVQVVVFPPLDDPAFYLTTAQNLVAGRGLEIDALWSYQVPFEGVTHPSHEHWMPLTTGLMAVALAIQRLLGGASQSPLRAGQMPGWIMGALLVPLTYWVGRWALPARAGSRQVALGAALLVAANATLSYQAASADSSAPFALLGAGVLAAAGRKSGTGGGFLSIGLLIGLAYLTRADGLLFLLAVPLAWWLGPRPAWNGRPGESSPEVGQGRRRPGLVGMVDMGAGFFLVVIPWLVRNYLAFGTPLPSSVLHQAWLTDYLDTFNYLTHPTWRSWMAQGWVESLAQRGQALLHNGKVFLVSTFPWGVLALPGLWWLRREPAFFPSLVYSLLLYLVMALAFPVSSMSGTFYHSLGAVTPFWALSAVYAVQVAAERFGKSRDPRLIGPTRTALVVGLAVLSGAQAALALPTVAARHRAEKEQYEAIARWLADHAAPGDVVMTTQPYTLHYASGHPCIVLPGNESPEAAWQAAQRYGARYLVITQTFGQYPRILHDRPDPRFLPLVATDDAEIYAIQGETP